jgi:hypothetical protein
VFSRRSKINLVLSTVVLLLATGIYLASEMDVGEEPVPLTGFKSEDITQIRIKNQQGRLIGLEKQDSEWFMTSPYRTRADAVRVSGLLRIATTPTYLRLPAQNLDPDIYGLSAPIAFIYLNEAELAFGSTEPVHRRRYVLVDGRINLIDDGFYHHLMAKPEGFVAKPLAQDSEGTREQGLTTESQRAQRAQRLHYEKAK